MKRLLILAAALAAAGPAWAQAPTIVSPAATSGFGTVSVSTSSIALSTVTLGPSSAAFPVGGLPNQQIAVSNSPASAGIAYLCPLGGTCTTANGLPLAVGERRTLYLKAAASGQLTSPTVIAVSTATVVADW